MSKKSERLHDNKQFVLTNESSDRDLEFWDCALATPKPLRVHTKTSAYAPTSRLLMLKGQELNIFAISLQSIAEECSLRIPKVKVFRPNY